MRRTALLLLVAATACASSRSQHPDVLGAQRDLARQMISQRDWARAFPLADALCRGAPEKAEGFVLRGIVYREQNLLEEAEADLKEALRLDGNNAAAHSALAILFDLERRSGEALEQHQRAVELAPRDPQYLNNLGFSLFAHGRPRDAIRVLHEALREAPVDARIRNNLGFAYAATGDYAHAAEHFAFAGTAAQASNNLGWAYERRGALSQAYENYLQAVRLDPDDAAARQNLARVARELGRDVPPEAQTPGA